MLYSSARAIFHCNERCLTGVGRANTQEEPVANQQAKYVAWSITFAPCYRVAVPRNGFDSEALF